MHSARDSSDRRPVSPTLAYRLLADARRNLRRSAEAPGVGESAWDLLHDTILTANEKVLDECTSEQSTPPGPKSLPMAELLQTTWRVPTNSDTENLCDL